MTKEKIISIANKHKLVSDGSNLRDFAKEVVKELEIENEPKHKHNFLISYYDRDEWGDLEFIHRYCSICGQTYREYTGKRSIREL